MKRIHSKLIKSLGFSFILFLSVLIHVEAQSDGDNPGGSSGGGSQPGDTVQPGDGGDSGSDQDGGGSPVPGDTGGGGDSNPDPGEGDSGSDQDDGSNPEQKRNPHSVSIDVIRKLDGNVVFTLNPGSLPAGTYQIRSGDDLIVGFELPVYQEGLDRRVVYADYPNTVFELPLDFEILGKNIQVVSDETTVFSDYVAGNPRSVNTASIVYSQENGNTVLTKPLDPYRFGLEASDASLQLIRTIDGSYLLHVSYQSYTLGNFVLLIGGEQRGAFFYSAENKGSVMTLDFSTNPGDEEVNALDFEFLGQEILIKRGENIQFAGVINLPVEIPESLSHIGMEPVIYREPILFEGLGSAEYPGLFKSEDLGYFNSSLFPFLSHCLLGLVEYRYTQGRNFLVSEAFGPLEVMENADSKLLYSYKTGEYFLLSETTEDCTLTVPGEFYNAEKEAYQSEVLPPSDDVQAHYELAFKATQMTQLRSSETIALVQQGQLNDAFVRLTDAVTYRNQTILLALSVIHTSVSQGEAVDFWNEATVHLINTADSALILAQETYSAAVAP